MKPKNTKIKTYVLEATIPISKFGNIRPKIELETDNITEAQKFAMKHIKELYSYSIEPIYQKKEKKEILKSFNENVEVKFESIKHNYIYNLIPLLSATTFTKQFYPKFDAEMIAINCEPKWKVKSQNIQDMWSSNGQLARDFGEMIHSALEHYLKFKEIGKIIQENTGKEINSALPKHPFLRMIIEEFEKIDKYKGESLSEVFITDIKNKRCGRIDKLLITGIQTCRIQDYKINVNSEEEQNSLKAKIPFNELPSNKLTKYQIQLSFYASCLKQSGWNVEGLDIFVYENKWKHYELDILEI